MRCGVEGCLNEVKFTSTDKCEDHFVDSTDMVAIGRRGDS